MDDLAVKNGGLLVIPAYRHEFSVIGEVRYSGGEINIDSIDGSPSKHSITTDGGDLSRFAVKWQRRFSWGYGELGGEYIASLLGQYSRQLDKFNPRASLVINFF